jgi:hypothetical protein
VLIDVVDRNLPSIAVVTEFTLCAILAAMEISVAILAFLTNVAEIQVNMAIEALNRSVASAQRKPRLRMSEFSFRPDRLPALSRMTLLAWNFQFVPVGTASESTRLDLLTNRNANRQDENKTNNFKTLQS